VIPDDEFDPEFRKLLRKLITERLAQEAMSGRPWQQALEQLKDIFEIDRAEIERDIASKVILESWKAKADPEGKNTGDESAKSPESGTEKPPPGTAPKPTKASPWSIFMPGGKPQFGEGVRGQVFEVVVRQGVVGAPWRSICAGPMAVNNIDPDDVQIEINRRLKVLGREPQTFVEGLNKKDRAHDSEIDKVSEKSAENKAENTAENKTENRIDTKAENKSENIGNETETGIGKVKSKDEIEKPLNKDEPPKPDDKGKKKKGKK